MFLTILFSFYALLIRDKTSVAFYLSILIIASSVSGLLINNAPVVEDIKSLLNIIFVALTLFIFVYSFKNYSLKRIEDPHKTKKLKYILFIASSILILVLIANYFIVYKSFHYVVANKVNITSYKNEGEAALLIRQWFSPLLVTFVNVFSPLGYLALSFHFYFLVKKKIKLSLFFLLLALNIPLNGLHALSRAASAQFILVYIAYYFYVYSALDNKTKLKINISAVFVITLILTGFYFITDARFSDSNYYTIDEASFIQNSALYSLFSYFSQWSVNGLEAMNQFSLDQLWYGKSSTTLIDLVMKFFGYEAVSYQEIRYETLGRNASGFIGLIATLVYDFSHVLALFFSLIFFLIVRGLGPRKGVAPLSNFILFSVLIPLPVMFFTNNQLSAISLNMGIVYSIAAWFIIRLRL